MLMPKRVKFRRMQRGRMTGKATRGNTVSYGEYGLMALEPGWVKSNQIEAARIAMTRYTKRGGQVWIKIFPDKSVTMRAADSRMGSGKGTPEYWVAVVKPQRVMFEIAGVPEEIAREALRLASHKLPCKTKIVKKANEIRKMNAEQLNEKLTGLKKDLFMLRMQHATNQLDNPVKIREVKHDIARVKTVLAELAASDKQ